MCGLVSVSEEELASVSLKEKWTLCFCIITHRDADTIDEESVPKWSQVSARQRPEALLVVSERILQRNGDQLVANTPGIAGSQSHRKSLARNERICQMCGEAKDKRRASNRDRFILGDSNSGKILKVHWILAKGNSGGDRMQRIFQLYDII